MNCLNFKSSFALILIILMLFETLPGVFAYEADAQTGCVVDQSFSSDSDLDDFTVEIPDGKTYSYSATGGLSFKNLNYAHVIYDNPVSGNYMFKVRARSADKKDIDIYLNYSDDAYYLLKITSGTEGAASIIKYSGSSETVLATSSGFAQGGYFTIYCYEDTQGVYHIDANMTWNSKTASISAVDNKDVITQGKIWINVPNTTTAVNEWKINKLQKIVSADIQTEKFPIDGSMTLTFDYPLSETGVLGNVSLLNGDAKVDYSFNLSDDSKTLTITPKSDLAYGSL